MTTSSSKTNERDEMPFKAYRNQEFLNSAEARPIRVHCELMEPAARFQKHKIENTIVFFGSARILSPEKAQEQLKNLRTDSPNYREELREAQKHLKASHYYQKAVELAHVLTKWSLGLPRLEDRMHIITGGGYGIMEAASKGCKEAGGRPIGMNITLPKEPNLNPYCDLELSFRFHYFFVRKYWLFYLTKAMAVFPGGFGTLDELFEVLTLLQTRKTKKYVPTVLFGSEFWGRLIDFDVFYDWGTIRREDLKLFRIVDTVEEAADYLISELTQHYVNGAPISEEAMLVN